jgi:hypothetical protein
MRKYSFVLTAAIVSMASTAALAQVPRLDIEKTCRSAQPLFGNPTGTANNTNNTATAGDPGNLGNANDANTYQNCMDSENAAKKSSADLWAKVAPADRTNCVGLSQMVYPSYVELLSCLQMYDPTVNGSPAMDQAAPRTRTRQNQRP